MANSGDGYEQKYMSGEGEVLHRSKMKVPWWFFLFFAVPVAFQLIVSLVLALTVKAAPLAVMLMPVFFVPFFAVMALLFAVLRITVTTKIVHVQYGLFGPKIPVESIESAEAVHYDWKKYGGFGIRRGRDGSWAYNMMGDAGRAVKIVWRDAKGKTNTHLVVAPDPDALAASIQQARSGTRLRIEDTSDAIIAEAEREAEELEKRRA